MPQPIVAAPFPDFANEIPDSGVPDNQDLGVQSTKADSNYKIPPVAWVFVFLIGGYLGLRSLME